MFHGDLRALDLPFVGLGAEAEHGGLVLLGGGVEQVCDEAVGLYGVVVNQLGQRVEPVVGRHVELKRKKNAVSYLSYLLSQTSANWRNI